MRHHRRNFKFAGSLEEVVAISRRMTGKTLKVEARKEQHKKHMKDYREKNKC
jgi:hypothetical protein